MTDETKANIAVLLGVTLILGIAVAFCVSNGDRFVTAITAAFN